MRDELSIFFENPATDPLGHERVEGKVVCAPENLSIQFKLKDRAFKKNEVRLLEFDYAEIESVGFHSRLFGAKLLTIITRGTDKLKSFPGAEVGRVVLHVLKPSRNEAAKAAGYVEYRLSESYLNEKEARLADLRKKSDP